MAMLKKFENVLLDNNNLFVFVREMICFILLKLISANIGLSQT